MDLKQLLMYSKYCKKKNEVKEIIDGHHIVHHLGHLTASNFGFSPQALALCTYDYNYGCIHGYFQHALHIKDVEPEDASSLCNELIKDPKATVKDKAYCFHGLGHGVMMFNEYNLLKSILFCDELDSDLAQNGCYQGVFMENLNNATQNDGWKQSGFSFSEPLAPCSLLAPKYHHQCFIHQGGWLMHIYNLDYQRAIQECLKAPSNSVTYCVESITLMVTNPGWQKNFLKEKYSDKDSVTENAWKICKTFPKDILKRCLAGGVDNLMNFDSLNLTRPEKFCKLADKELQDFCFRRIGMNLVNFVTDKSDVVKTCKQLRLKIDTKSCLDGLGV